MHTIVNYYEHCGTCWGRVGDKYQHGTCPDCRDGEVEPFKTIELDEISCFFCGNEEVVEFNEHYVFCKNCTAIYTECIVVEKHCEHIKENVVMAEREPWFRKLRRECRDTKAYVLPNDANRCSICNSITIADGW